MNKIYFSILFSFFTISTIFSQVNLKKGYIVDLKNDTIAGYIQVVKQINNHNFVKFSTTKDRKSVTKYLPTEIKAFCIGKDNLFESFEIDIIDKNLIQTEEKSIKFLKVISSGDISFLLYQPDKLKYFYLKNEEGNILPLSKEKFIAEYREESKNNFILKNGTRINLNPGVQATSKNNNYYNDGDSLYVLHNTFLRRLNQLALDNNCKELRADRTFKLAERELSNFSEEFHSCKQTSKHFKIWSKKPSFQISLLGIATTRSEYEEIEIGNEYGFLIELRQNQWSPNASISFGKSWFPDSFNTSYTIINSNANGNSELVSTVNKLSVTTIRLNYHLRPSTNIRPYFSLGMKGFKQSGKSYNDFTEENFDEPELADFPLLGAIGVDLYFLKFNQLRAEASYAKGLELSIGYGFYLK